jgi:ATP-dependent DNA helicase RecG
MTQTQDGFRISEEDLALRGPGEFLGTRQSGIPEFKIADIIQDMKLLEAARTEAAELVGKDPALTLPQNAKIKKIVEQKFKDKIELVSI